MAWAKVTAMRPVPIILLDLLSISILSAWKLTLLSWKDALPYKWIVLFSVSVTTESAALYFILPLVSLSGFCAYTAVHININSIRVMLFIVLIIYSFNDLSTINIIKLTAYHPQIAQVDH